MKRHAACLVLAVAVASVFAAGCKRDDDAYDTPAAAPPAAAAAADTAAGTATPAAIRDTDFYEQALQGGRKEVAAATLASGSAQDPGVKSFADMLVADHTAMNQQVMAAAGQADAAAPAPDATATADLQGRTGAAFDRAFVDKMVGDHQAAIALFENAAQNGSTDQARSLAQGALPKLRAHLQAAQDLQAKLGGAEPGT